MDSYSDDYGYLLLIFRIFLPPLVKKKNMEQSTECSGTSKIPLCVFLHLRIPLQI